MQDTIVCAPKVDPRAPSSISTSLSLKGRVHLAPLTPDLEKLPPTAACTTRQVHQAFGFAIITLKKWRREGKGPRVTLIEGRPRYLVRDLREWAGIGPGDGYPSHPQAAVPGAHVLTSTPERL